jgi:hypothetical protein
MAGVEEEGDGGSPVGAVGWWRRWRERLMMRRDGLQPGSTTSFYN